MKDEFYALVQIELDQLFGFGIQANKEEKDPYILLLNHLVSVSIKQDRGKINLENARVSLVGQLKNMLVFEITGVEVTGTPTPEKKTKSLIGKIFGKK